MKTCLRFLLPCGNPVLLIWVGLSNDTPNKTSVNKHEHGPNMLYLWRHTHTHRYWCVNRVMDRKHGKEELHLLHVYNFNVWHGKFPAKTHRTMLNVSISVITIKTNGAFRLLLLVILHYLGRWRITDQFSVDNPLTYSTLSSFNNVSLMNIYCIYYK